MVKEQLVNRILDRLPMALSGITHVNNQFTGEVCPKLNIMLTKANESIC
ncbi:hypothetical protein NSA47_12020 [Irregularibacter muris]|uniref:Uncharacterized protein n=1 Tax=Irregularibacter muris TaxID=1796619 RepID=A0AAE3L497_9FIRM|nr:hypothetical protein [Irregularibacter muris]MCR1899703.1 hypothetical protein [Irregularibacter muris]